MNVMYVVWIVLFAPDSSEADDGATVDCSVGIFFDDEGDAHNHALNLVTQEGAERVMVMALRPWTAPELICTLGEFSGKECLDWFGTQRKLERSFKAAVTWVSDQYDLVKKVEVPL